MFDPNESMRHLMMFETWRSQQAGMRHLHSVMAEDHRRMMKVPRPSVYRADAANGLVSHCPVCRSVLEQGPGMAYCGFCGVIVSYEPNVSKDNAIRYDKVRSKTQTHKKKVTDRAKLAMLLCFLVFAGLFIIFYPVENIKAFAIREHSLAETILISLFAGALVVAVLYILLKTILWIRNKIIFLSHEKRNRQYHF